MKYFTAAQLKGEYLADASGQVVQISEYRRCDKKARTDPGALTNFELAILEHFGGTPQATVAANARDMATRPAVAVAAAEAPAAPPVSPRIQHLKEITRQFRKAFRPQGKQFDRVALAESVRAKRAQDIIVPGGYSPINFTVALHQLHLNPAGLTDVDISELGIVDPGLADRARAARSGQDPRDDEDDDGMLDETPVSVGMLFVATGVLTDRLDPQINTIQRLARESSVRIDRLEERMYVGTTHTEAEGTIKGLIARIEALETKPLIKDYGVWRDGTSYPRGAAVSRGGSLWIAQDDTSEKPGVGATKWRLAVKAGTAGGDLR